MEEAVATNPILIPGSSEIAEDRVVAIRTLGSMEMADLRISAEDRTLEEAVTVEETKIIDLKWALIDGEWVIYKKELDEWVRAQRNPGAPPCPVCKVSAGIQNIRVENGIKRGICKKCYARLAILP
jgi:hypothetical protein